MKKIIIATLLIFNSFSYAQHTAEWITVPLEDALDPAYMVRDFTYFKDINHSLDKFVGTWQYTQGGVSFKITFIKLENDDSSWHSKQKEDVLISRYEYKNNGNTIFETYTTNISQVNFRFLTNDAESIKFGYQEPSFTECVKSRIGDLRVSYSLNSSNQPTLTWSRTEKPRTETPIPCTGSNTVDISDFLAPANMVLTKVP
ncbi:DUF6705 family protein [Flavobacterium sp.]|uniref:DUF6705 family protein n=1 Tax=Flavobacterium sp. TaxID=239 RepID=UPI00374D3368